MFVEIVDALRCPRTHEESWLVLAATSTVERHVREGTLGCPICHAQYPIHDGIAEFAERTADAPRLTDTSVGLPPADHLAALLNLADPLGFAVLIGAWGTRADELVALVDAPPLLLVDAPPGVEMHDGLSGVRAGAVLPLASGAARAVATDAIDPARVADAARVTRVGGRLVAPADAGVPATVRELARDETLWVGERLPAPSAPVTLHVRRG